MNKFFRSTLLAGVVVVGLAGCGDDVTVVDPPEPPPPPPAQITSVTVTPAERNVASTGVAQDFTFNAAVTAEAGIGALTYAWTTTDPAIATVSGTTAVGTVTVLANAAAGSVGIQVTVTAANGATGNGTATINVSTSAATLVTITPGNGAILQPGQTLQASANVQGTGTVSQDVTWESLDDAVATVSSTGLITAVAAGTAVIKACSVQSPGVCDDAEITVDPVDPATVSINGIRYVPPGGPNSVPVVLTNVFGQIEIAVNVDRGGKTLDRVDIVVVQGGTEKTIASQKFATQPVAAAGAPAGAPVIVELSTNTAQLRQNGGIFVPTLFNGNSSVRADLFVVGVNAPAASNAIPVVLNNPDAIVRRSASATVRPPSLVSTSLTPSAVSLNDGNTYFKGTQTVDGFDYIAFSAVTPTSVGLGSDVCGASDNLVPAGAAAASGLALTGTYQCAGVEGGNDVTTAVAVVFPAGAVGPDGTPITLPGADPDGAGPLPAPASAIYTVTTAFTVPETGGESRWNMVSAAPVIGGLPGSTWVDNLGPAVTIDNAPGAQVAFNDDFDQPWVNASYSFAQDMSAIDGGGTVGVGVDAAAFPRAREFDGTLCNAPNLPTQTGDDFPETLTSVLPQGKQICTYAEDLLGNPSESGGSNVFGVDKGAPTARILGANPPAATPLPVLTPSTVSNLPNTTIFSIAAPPAAEAFGIEALDTRSGFHQGAPIANFPATYVFDRLTATGTASAVIGSYALATLLSDTYVRGAELEILGAGVAATGLGGVGYYTWSGKATDRAGNESETVTRNFAADHLAVPNITGLGFASAFYTPGAAAPFGFSANDDLEIIDATAGVTQHIQSGAGTALRYPFGALTPLGVRWDATITNVVNGAAASIPYFLFRVDEMCTGAGVPYAACPALVVAPYITTSKIPFTVDQATTDALWNVAAVPATNAGKLPTSVSANVNDVAGQPAAAPIVAPMLVTQFNPAAGISEQWSSADLIAWSGSTTASVGNIVATHVASTSIVVPYFDNASLWGLVGTEWVYCSAYPAPVLTDNGSHRFWTYTVAAPIAGDACFGAASFRVMGTKAGAGLFGPVV